MEVRRQISWIRRFTRHKSSFPADNKKNSPDQQSLVAGALRQRGFSPMAIEKISRRKCTLEQVNTTLAALETNVGLSQTQIEKLATKTSTLFKVDAATRLNSLMEVIQENNASQELCRNLVRNWVFSLSEDSFRTRLRNIQCLIPFYTKLNIPETKWFQKTPSSKNRIEVDSCVDFLVDFAGEEGAQKIILRHPRLAYMDVETEMKPRIEKGRAFGFTRKQLVNFICRNPRLLNNFDELQSKAAFFEDLGLSQADLIKMLIKCPRLFSLTDKANNRKVQFLVDYCGIQRHKVTATLKRCPTFLNVSIDKQVKPKVDYLAKALGITGDSLGKFVMHHLDVMLLSMETLESRINRFPKLNLTREQYIGLIKRQPHLLNFGDEVMREKIAFFGRFSKTPVGTLVDSPALWTYSLENRVKPRMKFMAWLHMSGYLQKVYTLHSVLNLSNSTFQKRFVEPYDGAVAATYLHFQPQVRLAEGGCGEGDAKTFPFVRIPQNGNAGLSP